MYTLIGLPRTRAFRVMWMLEELGQPYDLEPLPPRDPALAAINPSLKVPVLKDGADYVIDSTAILQYLADKHGRFTMTAGTLARAHQDSFTMFAVDDVESGLWQAAKHTFALPEEYRVPDAKRAARFDFDRAMATLSIRLGDRPFVMGESFTVPDIVLGHCLAWAGRMKWEIAPENVKAYGARLHGRPAYTAAAEKAAAAAA